MGTGYSVILENKILICYLSRIYKTLVSETLCYRIIKILSYSWMIQGYNIKKCITKIFSVKEKLSSKRNTLFHFQEITVWTYRNESPLNENQLVLYETTDFNPDLYIPHWECTMESLPGGRETIHCVNANGHKNFHCLAILTIIYIFWNDYFVLLKEKHVLC